MHSSSVPDPQRSSGARPQDLGLNASMLRGPKWAQSGSFSPTSATSKQKNMFSSGYTGPEYSVQDMVSLYQPSDLPKSMSADSVPAELLAQASQPPVLSQPFDRLQAAQLWKRKPRSSSADQTAELDAAAASNPSGSRGLEETEPFVAKTPGRSKFDMIAQSKMANDRVGGIKRTVSSDNRFAMHRQQMLPRSASDGLVGGGFGRSRVSSGSNKWQRGMKPPETSTWTMPRGGQTINTRSPRDNWQQMYNSGQHETLQPTHRVAGQVWNNNSNGALEAGPEEDNSGLLELGSADGFARMALKTQELEKERAAYNTPKSPTEPAWQPDPEPIKEPEPVEPVPLVMSEQTWWYKDPKGSVQGPFSSNDMLKWYRGNFFAATLPIRFRADGDFKPLGEFYPDPEIAFTLLPTPPAPKLTAPPGLPAPEAGQPNMFDNFGVGVKAKAGTVPGAGAAMLRQLQKPTDLYDTFGVGVQETQRSVQTRQLEKPAWASFGVKSDLRGRQLEPNIPLTAAPMRDPYQNQVHSVAPNSAWRTMPPQQSTSVPTPAPRPSPAPAPAPAPFKPTRSPKPNSVWGKAEPTGEHVSLGGTPISRQQVARAPSQPKPAPATAPAPAPKTSAQQVAPQRNTWGTTGAIAQNSVSNLQQRKVVPPRQQQQQQRQQLRQHQQKQRPALAANPKPAPAPAPSKGSAWADSSVKPQSVKPQKTLLEIQNEQAVEEAKRAAERAKEEARAAAEADAQRRKGVWGAQKQKPKSLAEIQMEEEMMRSNMHAETAGRRNKSSSQKSSWAGLAATGTSSAWSAGAGSKTGRKNDWPAVGSKPSNSWPAVSNKATPVVSTNQWPNLAGAKAKTNNSRNAAATTGNTWPSVSAVGSQQKQKKQQQPLKPKSNSVWGAKNMNTKSMSDIQREEQSGQHDWPKQTHSGDLAQMRNNLKSMLGIGGGRSEPTNGSGAWGNNSARPAVAQPMSLREIQAEEARQKSQTRAGASQSGGWAAKVSGSKTIGRTSNSVWGGSAHVRAKPMNEILQEESRKAALGTAAHEGAGTVLSPAAKEDELLWGGVQLDPSALAPPSQQHPQHQRQRQQHQSKIGGSKPSSAFGGPTMTPRFRRWCVQEMIRLSGHDDTTLVDYCFTLQHPAEIRESMSGTLGSTPGVSQFATEFIRKKKEQMSNQSRHLNQTAGSRGNNGGRGAAGGGRRNRRRAQKNNNRR